MLKRHGVANTRMRRHREKGCAPSLTKSWIRPWVATSFLLLAVTHDAHSFKTDTEALLSPQRGKTPLHIATTHNTVAGVRALLEHNADPSAVDKVCLLFRKLTLYNIYAYFRNLRVLWCPLDNFYIFHLRRMYFSYRC